MKTINKPTGLDYELFSVFRDVLPEEEAIKAARDAKRAFSFIRNNDVYKNDWFGEEFL